MIRHAAAAAFPVVPLPVAVIEPPLLALLVPPVGVPPLLPLCFLPASLPAIPVAPGHNGNRSRTPRHSQHPGKSGGVGAPRGSPSPPLRRDGTTAARQGNLDPIYR